MSAWNFTLLRKALETGCGSSMESKEKFCGLQSREKERKKEKPTQRSDEDRSYYLDKGNNLGNRGNDQHHEQGRHSTGRAVGKRYFLFPGLSQN